MSEAEIKFRLAILPIKFVDSLKKKPVGYQLTQLECDIMDLIELAGVFNKLLDALVKYDLVTKTMAIIHFQRRYTYDTYKPDVSFYCDFSKSKLERMTLDKNKVTCKKCLHMMKRDGVVFP